MHDALIHNSALLGAQLSGARRIAFPHNDWAALDTLLARERRSFQRVLIVLEGLYSMDGDMPELPRFVEIKHRHRAFLMVDEAHSFGVVGRRGLGVREHFGLDGSAVDIWMGTLSKALAGCGGYIAGERALVDICATSRRGSCSASACRRPSPPRRSRRSNACWPNPGASPRCRRAAASSCAWPAMPASTPAPARDTRSCRRSPGVRCAPAACRRRMYERGINVQPILHPAVPENSARLRFFLSSQHTDGADRGAVRTLAAELNRL